MEDHVGSRNKARSVGQSVSRKSDHSYQFTLTAMLALTNRLRKSRRQEESRAKSARRYNGLLLTFFSVLLFGGPLIAKGRCARAREIVSCQLNRIVRNWRELEGAPHHRPRGPLFRRRSLSLSSLPTLLALIETNLPSMHACIHGWARRYPSCFPTISQRP
jgi:hypothetical protein